MTAVLPILAVPALLLLVLVLVPALRSMAKATVEYQLALWSLTFGWCSFEDYSGIVLSVSDHTRVHLYACALGLRLWSNPHYRAPSFSADLRQNLKDVAVPGTGIPLSVYAYSRVLAAWFLFVLTPIYCIIGALRQHGVRVSPSTFAATYNKFLLTPDQWFHLWQLNCRLAAYHAMCTDDPEYKYEDKWSFLQLAKKLGVAVSPFFDETQAKGIVCKHRNEEGGLGYSSYTNASAGGDWIIQPVLTNDASLASMLPEEAPLSTFRVISISRGAMKSGTATPVTPSDITPLSCVWRAGRANAKTDHSGVLFRVDTETGVIGKGTTNVHWYQRGPVKAFRTPWKSEHTITHHPDTGVLITGTSVKAVKQVMDFVQDAHFRMCPHVPLCGWDVAFTAEHGMLLLEVNMSANFFRGTFDMPTYIDFVAQLFSNLEARRKTEALATPKASSTDVTSTPPQSPSSRSKHVSKRKLSPTRGATPL